MPKRGVLYMIWGQNPRHEEALERSIRSLGEIHPELPVSVFRSDSKQGEVYGLIEKSHALRHSPFEETLLLDLDTVVMGKLDYGFEKAQRFGLACCICECPWARRYVALQDAGNLIEYNTGVVFFTRAAAPVFEAWERLASTLDSTIHYIRRGKELTMAFNDQCGFAAAIDECSFNPFVLPQNWNYRPEFQPTFFGPIVVWHSYGAVFDGLVSLNRHYNGPPTQIQMHKTDYPLRHAAPIGVPLPT